MQKFYLNDTVRVLMADSGFDRTTSEELVNVFCEQAQDLIIEANRKLSGKDLQGVRLLLHRLKGSAGNVRAREIAQLALEAEGALECSDVDKVNQIIREIEDVLRKFQGGREGS